MRRGDGRAENSRLLDAAVELCARAVLPLSADERASARRMLAVCLRFGMLHVEGERMLAFFRYGLEHRDAVAAQDLDALERAALYGPLVHIVAIVWPGAGGKIFNAIVRGENAMAVSAHRTRNGNERLHFKINRHYRRAAE